MKRKLLLTVLSLVFPISIGLTIAGKLECCPTDRTPCPVYPHPTNVVLYVKNKIQKDRVVANAVSDPKTGNFVVKTPSDQRGNNYCAYVQIEHICNAKPGCRRLLKFDVPQVFIKRGWTFSLSHINLRNPFHGSNTDICSG